MEHKTWLNIVNEVIRNDSDFASAICVAVKQALYQFNHEIRNPSEKIDYATVNVKCGYMPEQDCYRFDVKARTWNGIFRKEDVNEDAVIREFKQYVNNFVELTTTDEYNHRILEAVLEQLEEIPKKGEWTVDEYGIYHCPFCKAINTTVYKSFCPNCGASMREGR